MASPHTIDFFFYDMIIAEVSRINLFCFCDLNVNLFFLNLAFLQYTLHISKISSLAIRYIRYLYGRLSVL